MNVWIKDAAAECASMLGTSGVETQQDIDIFVPIIARHAEPYIKGQRDAFLEINSDVIRLCEDVALRDCHIQQLRDAAQSAIDHRKRLSNGNILLSKKDAETLAAVLADTEPENV